MFNVSWTPHSSLEKDKSLNHKVYKYICGKLVKNWTEALIVLLVVLQSN